MNWFAKVKTYLVPEKNPGEKSSGNYAAVFQRLSK